MGTTARKRPADSMRGDSQQEPESGRWRLFERQHRGRGQTGKQGASALTSKQVLCKAMRRSQSTEPETGERQGMAWKAGWAEQGLFEKAPVGNQRIHQLLVGRCILAERSRRLLN